MDDSPRVAFWDDVSGEWQELPPEMVEVTAAAPTQSKHPGRAVLRTVVAAVVGLLSLLPEVLIEAGAPDTLLGAQVLAVTGAVTRVLAMPAVEGWLRRYVPWLSAEPGN